MSKRKVIIYVASSLNGFIAKQDGDVDWLEAIPNPNQSDYGYAAFYDSIDTTLMGNKTYQKVLSFGVDFPYPDKENFVFTRNQNLADDQNVQYVSEDAISFVRELKSKQGKHIWLVGGGEVNSLFLNAGLVDEIQLFVMPYMFGKGIPLFSSELKDLPLTLSRATPYPNGVLECIYSIEND